MTYRIPRTLCGVIALSIAASLASLSASLSASATTIYDPTLGTLPSQQGWTTNAVGSYAQSLSSGLFDASTTPSNATLAGSAISGLRQLDTSIGFTLDFDLAVLAESHSRADRAGFSVIVTGIDPSHEIEIAFWTDHVWIYTSGFGHGADASFDTTGLTDYSLRVSGQQFALSADGASLLGGSLVNYPSPTLPYAVPGFLFFGDDTTSAQSNVQLGAISLAPAVPEPSTFALLLAGLAGLAASRRRSTKRPA